MLMSAFPCDARAEQNDQNLQALLKQIDTKLYEQSETDVRGVLDKLIETYWKPGQTLNVNYDTGGHGAICAMWFRGYEMLGEKEYLQAGLDFVDAILQTQLKNGMFPQHATLRRNGKSEARGSARLEDEHNFVQFALVCYAYKLTKDKKYLDAALQHAETLRSCQDPGENEFWQGPWPHSYHGKVEPQEGEGYQTGYMLNDYATSASMRTMIMAYKLSGDKKYIDRLKTMPAYMLNANVGLGNVRGWRGQADAWNETGWQRSFEGPLIDPRNFNRFASPMLLYFSAVTGDPMYANMVRESYDWLCSVEQPKGWFYKYTYDGRGCDCVNYRHRLMSEGHLGHMTEATRRKVVLDAVEEVLVATKQGDVEGLRKWYGPRPVKFSHEQYPVARIEASRRVTDEERIVRLSAVDSWRDQVPGKFLERVRERPLKSPKLGLRDGCVWTWWPIRYRGWAAWQYVWDVRVALGKIDADTAAWGGRGIESGEASLGCFPAWDCIGDWSTMAVEVEDWTDIPLNPHIVKVKSVQLSPASMTLKPGESREVKTTIAPDDATCKTGVWTSSNPSLTAAAAKRRGIIATAQPHMLDKIDPSKERPSYRREGKIMIHAGNPQNLPAKTTITFTSTDGKQTATCEVTVTQ